MNRQELRLAGSGGQGVILATVILAEAAISALKVWTSPAILSKSALFLVYWNFTSSWKPGHFSHRVLYMEVLYSLTLGIKYPVQLLRSLSSDLRSSAVPRLSF